MIADVRSPESRKVSAGVTEVVVRDDRGRPLALFAEPEPGLFEALRVGDANFAAECRRRGLGEPPPESAA